MGFASMGVMGVDSLASKLSRFFSAVFRKALVVMRRDLLGLQSSCEIGVCSHTGQVARRACLPGRVLMDCIYGEEVGIQSLQFSQTICSQQGVRKALTANLLQMAQRSLIGTSSCGRELSVNG